ncbi:DUF6538 domain-containing protein, partial [Methylorubrum rhodinum]|uniref:DUF6538 domain-containing protein n=1 Tax=Methylorubrum rhodinum TaxID=29428 RepID=UPI003BAEC04A
MKFVQRRAGRYEFRFPLPDDLAGTPVPPPWPETLAVLVNVRTGRFKTELIRSLKTNDGPTADRRVLAHIAEVQRLVDQARRFLRDGPVAGIGADQIAALAREHEIHLLSQDEAIRAKGLGLDMTRDEEAPHDGLGMTLDWPAPIWWPGFELVHRRSCDDGRLSGRHWAAWFRWPDDDLRR